MNNIKFSVIIPTYNRALKLRKCINSIIVQTYHNWEAIIVDNYSEDETESIVNSYNDNRIRYIKNHNYGIISISRNKALDVARGEWICFLDSDDYWHPKKLESILPYINSFDLVYHGYIKNFRDKSKSIFQKNKCYFYDVKDPSVPYVLQRGDPFNPSCTCISKNIIGKTRFSEDKSLIAVEDYDFFLQLLEKNIKIKFLKKALTYYDVSGCSHDGKSHERDRLISGKWSHKLNDSQKVELKIQESLREANDLWQNENYEDAIKLLKESLKTKILSKKLLIVKVMLYCYFKLFLRDFKQCVNR